MACPGPLYANPNSGFLPSWVRTMQVKQLEKIVQITGFSEAEIMRRAFDEYVERRFPNVSQYSNKSTE